MHQKLALFLLQERKHLLGILHELHNRPQLSDMDSDSTFTKMASLSQSALWYDAVFILESITTSVPLPDSRKPNQITIFPPFAVGMRSISFSPLYLHQTRLMWQTLYCCMLSVKVKFVVVLIVEAGIPTQLQRLPVEALGWDFFRAFGACIVGLGDVTHNSYLDIF